MTTYSISTRADGADAALHRMVLAGLPNSFRLVDGDAEVALLSAPDPAEFERLCASGTRAVVIDRPGLLEPDHLAAIAVVADRSGCIVMPAPRYAPRLAVCGDLLGDAGMVILDSTITSRDSFRASLVEQLALVRTVLGGAESIRGLHISASHYAFEATMAEHPKSHVLLNGVASSTGTEEATVHGLAPSRRLLVRIDAGPMARPADIRVYRSDGVRTPWPVHRHAHRITLVELHRLLSTGEGEPSYSLDHLRHDVQLADVPW